MYYIPKATQLNDGVHMVTPSGTTASIQFRQHAELSECLFFDVNFGQRRVFFTIPKDAAEMLVDRLNDWLDSVEGIDTREYQEEVV